MAADTDRLRAAAVECDRLADEASKQPPGYSWMVDHYRKTAALLRAVAEKHGTDECLCDYYKPGEADPACTAALDLADVILGGES